MVYKINAQSDSHYVEEFRLNPIGVHSPGLQRILNVMRLYTGGDQYILIARREFDDYVLGRMPPSRNDPIVIEGGLVFSTREEAEWELFRRRWQAHTGDSIDRPYR